MDPRLYAFLKWTALALGLLWLAWAFYDHYLDDGTPGLRAFQAGSLAFEDGDYARALAAFDQAIAANPRSPLGHRGRAITLLQMGRPHEALKAFDEAIALAPEFAGSYANRGILFDRMGEHAKALADYEQALTLDAELVEGPGWLTRLLRNQAETPATVRARAAYLREQLELPPEARKLRDPAEDRKQRSYRVD